MTTVADYFRDYAPRYDSFASRAMPRYQEMLSEIVRCLPDHATDVLELGCGTGSLTALLARRYPEGRIVTVDAADEMIARARERLGSFAVRNGQVTFVSSLFEEMDVPERTYDLIVSNMSLHHVADKAPLYIRLQRALRPGGSFILGDELRGAMPRVEQLNRDGWLEYARRSGNLSATEIADIIRHEQEFDHYETLTRQIELLRGAGFASADCAWRYLNYAVFVAEV